MREGQGEGRMLKDAEKLCDAFNFHLILGITYSEGEDNSQNTGLGF